MSHRPRHRRPTYRPTPHLVVNGFEDLLFFTLESLAHAAAGIWRLFKKRPHHKR